jgi:gamma-glutamyltranspeptidase/glutathione hydrolase
MGPRRPLRVALPLLLLALSPAGLAAQSTNKPVLHGAHWVAVTGKPLGASAGAKIFNQGGNAVDAACGMLAAVATMWDVLSWGGETQALIYDPHTGTVIAINALGVAPTGATPAFFRSKGMEYPPEYGPLAAVTPGTPGGLMTMLAEYGTMSLEQVLAPALELAEGYPMEDETANSIERNKSWIKQWPYSRALFLTHPGEAREAPETGEIFRQPDLARTLRKLIETERAARKAGKSRKEAIHAAYDRFYRGDIAAEIARSMQEQGGLITKEDLANWRVKIEEPVSTSYRGIDVYKLTVWTQGPAMLQALNILEDFDLKSMGYNSARYINTVYQAMSLAFADRDFYYGDPAFAPEEPMKGLLSKEYAKARAKQIDPTRNDPTIRPGDPYPYQGGSNPYGALLAAWNPAGPVRSAPTAAPSSSPLPAPDRGAGAADTTAGVAVVMKEGAALDAFLEAFHAGTTSIEAADEEGWVVSVTPSGGWVPAVVAGHTGVGMSERMQSFVLDPAEGPFNVVRPGQRPRVTLTPTLALKDGKPLLSFAVQGGDTQDQNLLQFFLDVVEFGMTVQQAAEAANVNSYQMRSSFGAHDAQPGRILVRDDTPPWVRAELRSMGYTIDLDERTSGPINAISFDRKHGTMWGGSSNYGQDYGIAW